VTPGEAGKREEGKRGGGEAGRKEAGRVLLSVKYDVLFLLCASQTCSKS